MVDLLSYKKDDNGMRVWAEGGYYFWYTMLILQLWLDKFPIAVSLSEPKNTPSLSVATVFFVQQITSLLDKIRKGIVETAYLRNGQWYVAPFGDVRNSPMVTTDIGIDLQNIQQQTNADIAVITRINNIGPIIYKLKARPIRMNLHIPKNDCSLSVLDGIPVVYPGEQFTFYTGFNNKYPNKWAEICDMLSPKRLLSFFEI
jgi:hypothetical protein